MLENPHFFEICRILTDDFLSFQNAFCSWILFLLSIIFQQQKKEIFFSLFYWLQQNGHFFSISHQSTMQKWREFSRNRDEYMKELKIMKSRLKFIAMRSQNVQIKHSINKNHFPLKTFFIIHNWFFHCENGFFFSVKYCFNCILLADSTHRRNTPNESSSRSIFTVKSKLNKTKFIGFCADSLSLCHLHVIHMGAGCLESNACSRYIYILEGLPIIVR